MSKPLGTSVCGCFLTPLQWKQSDSLGEKNWGAQLTQSTLLSGPSLPALCYVLRPAQETLFLGVSMQAGRGVPLLSSGFQPWEALAVLGSATFWASAKPGMTHLLCLSLIQPSVSSEPSRGKKKKKASVINLHWILRVDDGLSTQVRHISNRTVEHRTLLGCVPHTTWFKLRALYIWWWGREIAILKWFLVSHS